MMVASFGTLGRIWSATALHCVLAASAVSWAKAVAMKAETVSQCEAPMVRATLANPPALPGMGEGVALEVDAAALPGGAKHLRDRSLDAFMGVADDQLDPTQAAAGELA
jgi:hypothetical protein